MTISNRRHLCARFDEAIHRDRKCLYLDKGACTWEHGRSFQSDCPHYVARLKRNDRRRSSGRPAVEPNPASTPNARLTRWRALLDAFQESTGIVVGTPPNDLRPLMNPEDPDGESRKTLEWSIPALGLCDETRWPGQDPQLRKVIHTPEFFNATAGLADARPEYQDRRDATKAWTALRDAARKVVEDSARLSKRQKSGKGLNEGLQRDPDARIRWASAWLSLPSELEEAARTLANAKIPGVKVGTGRAPTGRVQALEGIVRVLRRIRACKGGKRRVLTAIELTWLLILVLPDRFLGEDEMKLRARIEKTINL